MHYKGYLITKQLPNDEKLNKILEPYYENENNKSGFEWDWCQIGGRYGGNIKINFNPENNEDNWYCFHDRNNKYFISEALNELKKQIKPYYDELDWLQYMGLREKILYVDGAYYKDIIDFDITNCYVVIDDEQNIYVREIWDGEHFIEINDFEEKIKNINLEDKFITTIDFHD